MFRLIVSLLVCGGLTAIEAPPKAPTEAETTVIMAGGPSQAAISPPIGIPGLDNRSEWVSNLGIAPVATRGTLSVTVYVKKDDTTNYYVMVESLPGAIGANLLIDSASYGAIFPPLIPSLLKLPCLSGMVSQLPTVTLQGF